MLNINFKYIDLCAGIGGFHQALSKFGGECAFAAEIDAYAIEVYKNNYGIDADNDITKLNISGIPNYDVLCAGFPCQTFSKAGSQAGFRDTRGTLFFNIAEIIKATNPKFLLLENVRNLASHDHGKTWEVIYDVLTQLGYRVPPKPFILSPLHFGVPQTRDRVVIPCVRKDLEVSPYEIEIPSKKKTCIFDILDDSVDEKYMISEYEKNVIAVWDLFIKGVKEKVLGFPVWLDYLNSNPIPESDYPEWKLQFIQKNKSLYNNNKEFIDEWKRENRVSIKSFKPTDRKFEWQMGKEYSSLYEGIIQFRPSGVRVKKPDFLPALVAMVHIPIVGKYLRRITPLECLRLQSFSEDFIVCKNEKQAYKQFGNSVNVEVIKYVFQNTIMKTILKYEEENIPKNNI